VGPLSLTQSNPQKKKIGPTTKPNAQINGSFHLWVKRVDGRYNCVIPCYMPYLRALVMSSS